MNKTALHVLSAVVAAASALPLPRAHAQTNHYVWKDNPGVPAPPYTNGWGSAATNIQDAIDAAAAGDIVWVTNGVYDTGGLFYYEATNRVSFTRNLTVQSVNGPTNTIIDGKGVARCVYMNSGILIGFTLTNGYYAGANDGGGGLIKRGTGNAVVSNCVITKSVSASGSGGGGIYARDGCLRVYDSLIIGNRASAGVDPIGGGFRRRNGFHYLYNCLIADNFSASWGGGAGSGLGGDGYITLYNCIVSGNTAGSGGGCSICYAYNCTISNNYGSGSAAMYGALYHCTITGHNQSGTSLFMYLSLYDCLVVGNSCSDILNNRTTYGCTIVGNDCGNGLINGTHYNAIVYYNSSKNYNFTGSGTFTNSCTFPAVAGWDASNTTNAPLLIDKGSGYGLSHVFGNYRLTRVSPCLDTGMFFPWMTDPADARSRDLDGNPRIQHNNVDMGAYELRIPRGSMFSAE